MKLVTHLFSHYIPLFQTGGGIPGHEARLSHPVHHSNNARRRSIPEDPVLRILTKDFGCLNRLQCDREQSGSEPNRSNPPMLGQSVFPTEKKRVWTCVTRPSRDVRYDRSLSSTTTLPQNQNDMIADNQLTSPVVVGSGGNFFAGAQNFSITDGQFLEVHGNYNVCM